MSVNSITNATVIQSHLNSVKLPGMNQEIAIFFLSFVKHTSTIRNNVQLSQTLSSFKQNVVTDCHILLDDAHLMLESW
jgi:uncharacterized protein YbbC (DUF1343 family)